MRRLATASYVVLLAVAVLCAVGLFFRYRWAARHYRHAVSQVVRLEAEKSAIIAEAKHVQNITTPDAARGVIRAGARVASKVNARIESKSQAIGSATVSQEGATVDSTQGTVQATDEHKRFTVVIPYTCAACVVTAGQAQWSVTQRFMLESIEFEQVDGEGATIFKGFTATLSERSPVDDSVLGTYQAQPRDISAVYTVPRTGKRRLFVPWANVGLEYLPNSGETVPYGLVGVRVRRLGVWAGTFGSTPAIGVGWSFGG